MGAQISRRTFIETGASTTLGMTLASTTPAERSISKVPAPAKAKLRTDPLPENPPQIILMADRVVLENRFLKCELSLDKGPLMNGLINKFISQNVLAGPSRLFLIHRGTEMIANSQFLLISVSVEKANAAQVMHAVWRCIGVPIELDMRILLNESPELSWRLVIRNTGLKEETFGVTCPVIESICLGDAVADDLYFYPLESGICGGLDYEFHCPYGYNASMQVMDIFNPTLGGGLYTFTKDPTGYPKILILRKMSVPGQKPPAYATVPYVGQDISSIFDDNLAGSAMAIRHIEYQLAPGQSAELPEIVVGVHEGDWHIPLRRYSRWAHTWFQKPLPTPAWYMDTYAYLSGHRYAGLHVLSRQQETPGYWDTTRGEFAYSRQMDVAEENSLMEWAYWWRYDPQVEGRYLTDVEAVALKLPPIIFYQYGDYEYAPDLGGFATLREEITRIHDRKGKLLLYTHYDACWQGSKIGQTHGKQWAMMDRPGRYSRRYGGNGGWNMCPYISGWRNHFSQLMAERIRETRADGYRLDTATMLHPCYNSDHDHYEGNVRSSVSPQRMGEFLLTCQKTVRSVNPEAITTTEHPGSDYLIQFTDGYLAQNLAWVGDPTKNRFRSLNQYRIVFTRFYFPEAKVAIHGAQPSNEAIAMGLFNACAPVCMPHKEGALRFDAVRENGDAFNSLLEPEPLVDTLIDGVYANYFPGQNKRVWTIYNRTGAKLDCPLIRVPATQGVHYVEVYNDVPVKAVAIDQEMQLSAPVENEDVICIAQLQKVLQATYEDGILHVRSPLRGVGYRVLVSFDSDLPDKQQKLKLVDGEAQLAVPHATLKIIVKLMHGYYLVDQLLL